MAKFLKITFLIAIKLNFIGVIFINKYQNLIISKSGKKSFKIVKFDVENVEHLMKHLRSNTRVN